MEWLFRSEFDQLTVVALWSIAGVLVTTLILFVYTIGLRFVTVSSARRRHAFISIWREIFAEAVLSADFAANGDLPKVSKGNQIFLLEEWNQVRSIVEGTAAENLIAIAKRTDIPVIAARLIKRHRIQSKILAVQTFGHLHDRSRRDEIFELVLHDNTALSIMAANALVDIDADFAIEKIVPMINERRDWPKNRISILLRTAGSARISEPVYRAIRAAEDNDKAFLLQFARLVEPEVLDALLEDLIRGTNNPGVLNAALKLVSGFKGVPRIATLTQHAAWFVRMQAAKVLGRVGQREHLSLLESLLDDEEWWVRYRAAQSIVSLPFIGPNELRSLRDRQTDPYAADILQQSFAEVGIA